MVKVKSYLYCVTKIVFFCFGISSNLSAVRKEMPLKFFIIWLFSQIFYWSTSYAFANCDQETKPIIIVFLKGLPPVCMKYTSEGEGQVANIALCFVLS